MATKKKSDPRWMEKAAGRMKTKGTVGSFGKATKKKVAAAKKKGGKTAKKGNFAKVAAKVARKR
jgi:PDZ domain-containing secreted protein